MQLSLLVIRAQNPARLAEFYGHLGLIFKDEKHGKGPAHKACKIHNSVFEIYPCQKTQPPTTGTRIGFSVTCIEESLSRFGKGVDIVSPKRRTEFGTRVVLRDPEGHKVELTEMPGKAPSADPLRDVAANW